MIIKELRINIIWLYVKNKSLSIKFYRDVLGLEVAETFPDGALFHAGNIMLGIHREEGNRKSLPGGTVIILETNNIEKNYDNLLKKGVAFESKVKQEPYGKIATFRDPDGYIFELFQEVK